MILVRNNRLGGVVGGGKWHIAQTRDSRVAACGHAPSSAGPFTVAMVDEEAIELAEINGWVCRRCLAAEKKREEHRNPPNLMAALALSLSPAEPQECSSDGR